MSSLAEVGVDIKDEILSGSDSEETYEDSDDDHDVDGDEQELGEAGGSKVTEKSKEIYEKSEDGGVNDGEVKDKHGASKNKGRNIKRRKKKKEIVINHPKKIGPQKQKKMIHTILKKAKVYEIRKLTRRIETLRKLKGTEDQIAKNNRKSEKLIKEIDAMRGFIISTLTERTVDVFKGTADKAYLDIWSASQDKKTMEGLLQIFSIAEECEQKYSNTAYLRMLSSKDIVGRLKLIASGANIIEMKRVIPKSKEDSKGKNPSKGNELKKVVVRKKEVVEGKEEVVEKKDLVEEKVMKEKNSIKISEEKVEAKAKRKNNVPKQNNNENSNSAEENQVKRQKADVSSIESKSNKGIKKTKRVTDSFFLDHHPVISDNEDSDGHNEFSAPIKKDGESSTAEKRNRMGQRQRKQLVERKFGKSYDSNVNARGDNKFKKNHQNKHSSSNFQKHISSKPKPTYKKKEMDIETLHPSWQAKQKLKSKQNIVPFSGTKITFD